MEVAILIILCILVVVLFVMSYLKRKKYNNQLGEMRNELKIGDKVMTDTGVVGEVVDSYMEEEYKYFVLKSGKGSNVGYFTVHANAIYYVFGKDNQNQEKVVLNNSAKEEKVEEVSVQDKVEEVSKEEKPKTPKKRTTTKSSKNN